MPHDLRNLLLISDAEQELANAKEWFDKASHTDLIRVWMTIQQPFDDPAMEIVSRLAQLKFYDLFLELKGATNA